MVVNATTGRDRERLVVRIAYPAAAVGVLVVAMLMDPGEAWQVATVGLGCVALGAWAVRPTLPAWVVGLVVGVALIATGTHLRLEPSLFLVALAALLVGSVEANRVRFVIGTVGLLAVPPVIRLVQITDREWSWGTWMIGILFAAFAGRVYRRQLGLVDELEAARRELAERAVLEERRRIARDLHDLVGHGLSAVLLQVTSARHVLRRDVDAAEEALVMAEDVGRRSLQDVRQTVGGLRSDGSTSPEAPLPSAADVAELVRSSRAAGFDVTFTAVGPVERLRGTVGVSIYRIVQEGLANASRHARHARTEVHLGVAERRVKLEILSIGPVTAPSDGRVGFGVLGMRERASTLGGELVAERTDEGWRLYCTLPLNDRSLTP